MNGYLYLHACMDLYNLQLLGKNARKKYEGSF